MVFITFIVISFHKPFVVNLVVILKFSQFPPSLSSPPRPKKKKAPPPTKYNYAFRNDKIQKTTFKGLD